MLWGRAASRCSFPTCRCELVIDSQLTDDPSLVGEAAHIVAESPDGPRGQSPLTPEQRNRYENLILLCNVHHKLVDDQEHDFTVKRLMAMKADHEAWVRTSLTGYDPGKQVNDEQWAGYIDTWVARLDLDAWLDETFGLLQPIPEVSGDFFDRLSALRMWLLSRVWPPVHQGLQDALVNFRMVVDDLVNVFERHSETSWHSRLRTKQFYHIEEWDPPRYELLINRFDFHVDLLHDLTFEMTRAANYVCDKVREHLDSSFRMEQGLLLIRRGMTIDLKECTYRVEYRDQERTSQPYPGLKQFYAARESRDFSFGTGQPPV